MNKEQITLNLQKQKLITESQLRLRQGITYVLEDQLSAINSTLDLLKDFDLEMISSFVETSAKAPKIKSRMNEQAIKYLESKHQAWTLVKSLMDPENE